MTGETVADATGHAGVIEKGVIVEAGLAFVIVDTKSTITDEAGCSLAGVVHEVVVWLAFGTVFVLVAAETVTNRAGNAGIVVEKIKRQAHLALVVTAACLTVVYLTRDTSTVEQR